MAVTRNPFNARLSWKWLVAVGILAIAISLVIGIILGVIAVHFSNATSQPTTLSGLEEDERAINALQWQPLNITNITAPLNITILPTLPPVTRPGIPDSSSSTSDESASTFHSIDQYSSESTTESWTTALPHFEITSQVQDPLTSKVDGISSDQPVESTPSVQPGNERVTAPSMNGSEEFRNKPTNGMGQAPSQSWHIYIEGNEISSMSERPSWLNNTDSSVIIGSTNTNNLPSTLQPNNQKVPDDSPTVIYSLPTQASLGDLASVSFSPAESSATTPATIPSAPTGAEGNTASPVMKTTTQEGVLSQSHVTDESPNPMLMSEQLPSAVIETSSTSSNVTESSIQLTNPDSSLSDVEESRQCSESTDCWQSTESGVPVNPSHDFSNQVNVFQIMANEVPPSTKDDTTVPTETTPATDSYSHVSASSIHAMQSLSSPVHNSNGNTDEQKKYSSDEEFIDTEAREPDFPCPGTPHSKIYQEQLCNGEVDCPGGNDERNCSCRNRIYKHRICDGVIDCPSMEDEMGCRGCNENQFTCEIHRRRALCLPLKQRCDGVVQCPDGKDEAGCNLLAPIDHREELLQALVPKYSSGFIFRNIQNKWYPLCVPPTKIDISGLADGICRLTVGEGRGKSIVSTVDVQITNYSGKFAMANPDHERPFKVIENCSTSELLQVKCPPPQCGKKAAGHQFAISRLSKRRRRNAFNRIVGGVLSEQSSWPSIVAILKNGNFTCGGTLIGDSWVLSAAHCFESYHQYHYETQLGMLRTTSFSPFEQTRIIQNIYIHPEYNRLSLENDIVLLEVDTPFHLSQWAAPACLSATEFSSATRTQCIVIGWGDTFEGGSESEDLREVSVPLTRCTVETTVKPSKVLCAGYPDGQKDACQGDSGGPLMCPDPEASGGWTLAGVVSSGIGCARPGLAGVYTRLSYYLKWINATMENPIEPTKKPRHNCPGITCRKGAGQCLDKRFLCDTKIQCYDGEDEFNCHSNNITESYTVSTVTTLATPTVTVPSFTIPPPVSSRCPDGEFMCSRVFQCVSMSHRCNFVNNCIDGTDELNCTCVDYLIGLDKKKLICDDHVDCKDSSDELGCEYRCSTGEYIANSQLCDGVPDCPDGADESKPRANITCPKNVFRCLLPRQERSNETVPFGKVCNGLAECSNGADEQTCIALSKGIKMETDFNGNPKNFPSEGYLMVRLSGTWSPYCDLSWGIDKTSALCQYFGFNSTASSNKEFLHQNTPCNFKLYVTCS